MISNQQIRDNFISPSMEYYLRKKLLPLTPEEVDVRTEELLKYLNMAVYCDGGIPFSKDIDEVWHYWIMETREYQELCLKLHGRGFFHHTSNDYVEYLQRDIKSEKPDVERGINILLSYVKNYGSFEQERIKYWPLAQRLMSELGWTVDEFNMWLESTVDEESNTHEATEG